MKTLEEKLKSYLEEKYVAMPKGREKVEILLTEEYGLVGNIVSDVFNNLTAEEQQEQFKSLLNKFVQNEGVKRSIAPLVLLYSPEEYRNAMSYEHKEYEGTLRSVDVHTLSASDIVVRIPEKKWNALIEKVELNDNPDKEFEIQCAAWQSGNEHLYDTIGGLLEITIYKWFDCQGYTFQITSRVTTEMTSHQKGFWFMTFKAKQVNPWDLDCNM